MGCNGFRRVLGILSLSLGVLGTASLLVGVFLLRDATHYTNLPDFISTNCTLVAVQVIELPIGPGRHGPEGCGFTVLWKDESGATAVDDPFAYTQSKILATSRMIDYPLHTSVPCYCPPNPPTYPQLGAMDGCNVWGNCILEARMAQHIQHVGTRYRWLAEGLLAFSGAAVIASLVLSVIGCCCGGALEACCGCSRSSSGGYRSVNSGPPFV